jgi:hypothetical protein
MLMCKFVNLLNAGHQWSFYLEIRKCHPFVHALTQNRPCPHLLQAMAIILLHVPRQPQGGVLPNHEKGCVPRWQATPMNSFDTHTGQGVSTSPTNYRQLLASAGLDWDLPSIL